MTTTRIDYESIDHRFSSPARQAAKSLGVRIEGRPYCEAGAQFDRLRWFAEAFETVDGRVLVVSADDLGLSAAVVDDLPRPVMQWMDRSDMDDLCEMTGVRASLALQEARDDAAHCRAGLAAWASQAFQEFRYFAT